MEIIITEQKISKISKIDRKKDVFVSNIIYISMSI